MNIKEFLSYNFVLSYDDSIPDEGDFTPVTKPECCNKSTILFIYRRAKGGASVSPENIGEMPAAIVCESDFCEGYGEIPIITVKSCRSAYAHACYLHYSGDLSGIKLIGVTGTNGKTTTATLLYEILRQAGHSCGFFGTGCIKLGDEALCEKNYSMTTPDPDLLYKALGVMKRRGAEYVVMEVSSHALSLGKLEPISFELAIMTNLTSEHMDYHKDMWDYLSAKELLFKKSRRSIFNIDDYYARVAYSRAECERISVGAIQSADITLRDVKLLGLTGSEFIYRGFGAMFKVHSPLPGYHNIYNSTLALCGAIALGIKPCLAKEKIEKVEAIPGRCQIIRDKICIIIDYAHTPYAMENLLKFAKSCLISGQKLISVFGCGGDRDRWKRADMTEVALRLSDKLIITEDNTRDEDFSSILSDMLERCAPNEKTVVIRSRQEAIRAAVLSANDGDIVLLIGKGAEKYIIDSDGYHEYSEMEEARKALAERGVMRSEG